MRPSGGGSRALRAGVLALLAGLGVAVPARPAAAHAVIVEHTPAADAVLVSPPEAVTLRFNESVSAGLGGVKVFPTDGPEIVPEQVEMSPDGTLATARLPELAPGAYAVSWRVVSSDAHPVRGAFTFSVGQPAGAAAGAALAERLRGAGGGGSDAVGLVFGAARFGVFAGLSVLVGGIAFCWLVWPAGFASARARRVLLVAWALSLGCTLAGIGLQGAYASGGSLAGVFDTGQIGDVLESRFGIVWLLRAGLLLPVGAMILRMGGPHSRPPHTAARAADAATGAALLLTPGLSGHASTGDLVGAALVADLVHLAAVATWLGGLVLLCTAVLPARHPGTLAEVVPRFSRLGFISVVVIMASGTFQSWRQVRYADALTGTPFGRLLVAKLVVFAALLGVAAVSRRLVHGRLGRAHASSPGGASAATPAVPRLAGPGAMLADPDAETVNRLRRCVAAEAAVAAVVLALTAGLVNAVPGREAGADAGGPVAVTLEADGLIIEAEIVPARVGGNQIHVYSYGPDGVTATPIPELKATIAQPDRDLGPLPVALEAVYPGHWVANTVELPLPGTWTLAFDARISEFDQIRLDTRFPVAE